METYEQTNYLKCVSGLAPGLLQEVLQDEKVLAELAALVEHFLAPQPFKDEIDDWECRLADRVACMAEETKKNLVME